MRTLAVDIVIEFKLPNRKAALLMLDRHGVKHDFKNGKDVASSSEAGKKKKILRRRRRRMLMRRVRLMRRLIRRTRLMSQRMCM